MKSFAPKWIIDECDILGIQIINARRIEMGSVGESWKITISNNKQFFFKKVISNKECLSLFQAVHLCDVKTFLPNGYTLKITDYGFIQYYEWIEGNVLSRFDSILHSILKMMNELHRIEVSCKRDSPYLNIFSEIDALFTKDLLDLPEFIQKDIDYSISIIQKHLSNQFLHDMCNNYGILTHGDLKPLNVVYSKNKTFHLIDWDKVCTVSKEFEAAYMIYTGIRDEELMHLFTKNLSLYWNKESIQKMKLILSILPHMYLVHDVFNSLQKKEYRYLLNDVYPMYISWSEIVE